MSTKVVALLAFLDEMRYLPGWYEHVAGRVAGVVALDDGSTDGSGEYAASRPETVRLIRVDPRDKGRWDEPGNRRVLVTAGQDVGADWFLTIDADERVEDRFWDDLDDVVGWADREDVVACSFRLRELWGSPDQYRADGIWGRKTKAAFFRNLGSAHRFDEAEWHGEWVPMQVWETPACRVIDYELFHLKMIEAAARSARRARYEALDPDHTFQAEGYAYLTDETGIELRRIPPGTYRGAPPGGSGGRP